jgi:hypothetical protein
MNFRNWCWLACLFGPRCAAVFALAYYAGGAVMLVAICVVVIMALFR